MNWEATGAIGDVLGAVLVSSTLAFLAVEIRQAGVSPFSWDDEKKTVGLFQGAQCLGYEG